MNHGECITPTPILRSYLCDYSDAYILGKGTITLLDREQLQQIDKKINRSNKQIIFENSAPFTSCTTEVNNK